MFFRFINAWKFFRKILCRRPSADSTVSVLNNNNNNNKIFITVSMYLAHRANWGHLLLQN